MNALRKVLVVDDGQRDGGDFLSAELAELGLCSVTASFEAARDVLDVIERPSAIFLKMPRRAASQDRASFARLADELRSAEQTVGIPVIEWDYEDALSAGGISAVLRSEIGPQAFAGPEL